MKYPLSKYKFVVHENEVIAISTYAGKTVRGIAKCHPHDTMDIERGKILAANRCNVKIAQKRRNRARKKMFEALEQSRKWNQHYRDMAAYFIDADGALMAARKELEQELDKMK